VRKVNRFWASGEVNLKVCSSEEVLSGYQPGSVVLLS
jgi:hypothetical protein